MDDPLFVGAWPGDIVHARVQRHAHRMDAGHEKAVFAQHVERGPAHARHDAHRQHDIGAVGDLDADHAAGRAERTHAERHHIHGAPGHAAIEQPGQHFAGLRRIAPVVGRAGLVGALAANECAAFDARHIARVRSRIEAAGSLVRCQRNQGSGGHKLFGQAVPFLLRAIAPDDPRGAGQRRSLIHPRDQAPMADMVRSTLEGLARSLGHACLPAFGGRWPGRQIAAALPACRQCVERRGAPGSAARRFSYGRPRHLNDRTKSPDLCNWARARARLLSFSSRRARHIRFRRPWLMAMPGLVMAAGACAGKAIAHALLQSGADDRSAPLVTGLVLAALESGLYRLSPERHERAELHSIWRKGLRKCGNGIAGW